MIDLGLPWRTAEAIFLLVSLLLCALLLSPFRLLWRNPHTYSGMVLLPFVLYLPHLYWLSQHHWGGLSFLLSDHVSHGQNPWFYGTSGMLNDLVVNYNLFFLVGLWVLWKTRHYFRVHSERAYLSICAGLILVVYLLASLKLFVFSFWIAPFYFGFLLLTGPLFIQHYRRLFITVMVINSIIMIANNIELAFPQRMPGNRHCTLQRDLQQRSAQVIAQAIPPHVPIMICSNPHRSVYTSIGERLAMLYNGKQKNIFFCPQIYVVATTIGSAAYF